MRKWHTEPQYWSREQIQAAINNDHWQQVRVSMKGVSTEEKLTILDRYVLDMWCSDVPVVDSIVQCRVDNYINALKRGGQLNMKLEIVK